MIRTPWQGVGLRGGALTVPDGDQEVVWSISRRTRLRGSVLSPPCTCWSSNRAAYSVDARTPSRHRPRLCPSWLSQFAAQRGDPISLVQADGRSRLATLRSALEPRRPSPWRSSAEAAATAHAIRWNSTNAARFSAAAAAHYYCHCRPGGRRSPSASGLDADLRRPKFCFCTPTGKWPRRSSISFESADLRPGHGFHLSGELGRRSVFQGFV